MATLEPRNGFADDGLGTGQRKRGKRRLDVGGEFDVIVIAVSLLLLVAMLLFSALSA